MKIIGRLIKLKIIVICSPKLHNTSGKLEITNFKLLFLSYPIVTLLDIGVKFVRNHRMNSWVMARKLVRSQWPWPLTFGHQLLISPFLSHSGHLYQPWRNSLNAFLSYGVHKNRRHGVRVQMNIYIQIEELQVTGSWDITFSRMAQTDNPKRQRTLFVVAVLADLSMSVHHGRKITPLWLYLRFLPFFFFFYTKFFLGGMGTFVIQCTDCKAYWDSVLCD